MAIHVRVKDEYGKQRELNLGNKDKVVFYDETGQVLMEVERSAYLFMVFPGSLKWHSPA